MEISSQQAPKPHRRRSQQAQKPTGTEANKHRSPEAQCSAVSPQSAMPEGSGRLWGPECHAGGSKTPRVHLLTRGPDQECPSPPLLLTFMYTDRILRPYGSESTSASTGILSVVLSFFRNSLHCGGSKGMREQPVEQGKGKGSKGMREQCGITQTARPSGSRDPTSTIVSAPLAGSPPGCHVGLGGELRYEQYRESLNC